MQSQPHQPMGRSLDAIIQRHQNGSGPANVSGLLMGRPADGHSGPGSGLNGLSSTLPAHLIHSRNPVGIATAPQHQNNSLSASLGPSHSSSPWLNQSSRSTMNSTDLFASQPSTSTLYNSNQPLSLSHLATPYSSLQSSMLNNSAANGILTNGSISPRQANGNSPRNCLASNSPRNGLSTSLTLNGHGSVNGKPPRAKSEVEVLLTSSQGSGSHNAPTRKEIRSMSEDAFREAKLKRLLREAEEREKALASGSTLTISTSNKTTKESSDKSSLSPASNNSSSKSSLQQEGK